MDHHPSQEHRAPMGYHPSMRGGPPPPMVGRSSSSTGGVDRGEPPTLHHPGQRQHPHHAHPHAHAQTYLSNNPSKYPAPYPPRQQQQHGHGHGPPPSHHHHYQGQAPQLAAPLESRYPPSSSVRHDDYSRHPPPPPHNIHYSSSYPPGPPGPPGPPPHSALQQQLSPRVHPADRFGRTITVSSRTTINEEPPTPPTTSTTPGAPSDWPVILHSPRVAPPPPQLPPSSGERERELTSTLHAHAHAPPSLHAQSRTQEPLPPPRAVTVLRTAPISRSSHSFSPSKSGSAFRPYNRPVARREGGGGGHHREEHSYQYPHHQQHPHHQRPMQRYGSPPPPSHYQQRVEEHEQDHEQNGAPLLPRAKVEIVELDSESSHSEEVHGEVEAAKEIVEQKEEEEKEEEEDMSETETDESKEDKSGEEATREEDEMMMAETNKTEKKESKCSPDKGEETLARGTAVEESREDYAKEETSSSARQEEQEESRDDEDSDERETPTVAVGTNAATDKESVNKKDDSDSEKDILPSKDDFAAQEHMEKLKPTPITTSDLKRPRSVNVDDDTPKHINISHPPGGSNSGGHHTRHTRPGSFYHYPGSSPPPNNTLLAHNNSTSKRSRLSSEEDDARAHDHDDPALQAARSYDAYKNYPPPPPNMPPPPPPPPPHNPPTHNSGILHHSRSYSLESEEDRQDQPTTPRGAHNNSHRHNPPSSSSYHKEEPSSSSYNNNYQPHQSHPSSYPAISQAPSQSSLTGIGGPGVSGIQGNWLTPKPSMSEYLEPASYQMLGNSHSLSWEVPAGTLSAIGSTLSFGYNGATPGGLYPGSASFGALKSPATPMEVLHENPLGREGHEEEENQEQQGEAVEKSSKFINTTITKSGEKSKISNEKEDEEDEDDDDIPPLPNAGSNLPPRKRVILAPRPSGPSNKLFEPPRPPLRITTIGGRNNDRGGDNSRDSRTIETREPRDQPPQAGTSSKYAPHTVHYPHERRQAPPGPPLPTSSHHQQHMGRSYSYDYHHPPPHHHPRYPGGDAHYHGGGDPSRYHNDPPRQGHDPRYSREFEPPGTPRGGYQHQGRYPADRRDPYESPGRYPEYADSRRGGVSSSLKPTHVPPPWYSPPQTTSSSYNQQHHNHHHRSPARVPHAPNDSAQSTPGGEFSLGGGGGGGGNLRGSFESTNSQKSFRSLDDLDDPLQSLLYRPSFSWETGLQAPHSQQQQQGAGPGGVHGHGFAPGTPGSHYGGPHGGGGPPPPPGLNLPPHSNSAVAGGVADGMPMIQLRDQQKIMKALTMRSEIRTIGNPNSPVGLILLLAMPQDRHCLSETLCIVRNNVEVFTATDVDINAPAPGRKRPIRVGQVGLRCVYCRMCQQKDRVKRATCFPSSMKRIYRAVIDMKLDHFKNCPYVPPGLKNRLSQLQAGSTRSTGMTVQYFVKSAREMGMVDMEDGVTIDLKRVGKADEYGSGMDPIPMGPDGSRVRRVEQDVMSFHSRKFSKQKAGKKQKQESRRVAAPQATVTRDVLSSSNVPFQASGMEMTNKNEDGVQEAPPGVTEKRYSGKVLLSLSDDTNFLSPLRCFLREHVCAFTATERDIAVRTPTTFSVRVGQVGVGCIHCLTVPPKARSNRAVCFPFTVGRIYQSVADIQRFHLGECRMMPADVRAQFLKLQSESAKGSRGLATRTYWIDSAKKIGLADGPAGMYFCRDPSLPPPPTNVDGMNGGDGDSSTLDILAQVANNNDTTRKPLVTPDDKKTIAEFLYLVMEQLRPCRFTDADRNKRRSKNVGSIGVECKHCAGKIDGRKFFWSSVSAAESNFVSVHSHMLSCKYIPDSMKVELTRMKALRREQTSRLKTGSQKAFFTRVWARLHGTPVPVTPSSVIKAAGGDRGSVKKAGKQVHTPNDSKEVVIHASVKKREGLSEPPDLHMSRSHDSDEIHALLQCRSTLSSMPSVDESIVGELKTGGSQICGNDSGSSSDHNVIISAGSKSSLTSVALNLSAVSVHCSKEEQNSDRVKMER